MASQTEKAFSKTALTPEKRADKNEAFLLQKREDAAAYFAERQRKRDVGERDFTGADAAKFAAEMTPGIGDVMAAKDTYDYLNQPDANYLIGAGLVGATILGFIPGIGDITSKGINKLLRRGTKTNSEFSGDMNLIHGFYGDEATKKPKNFTEGYSGIRFDDSGGTFGDQGVYLEDPKKPFFNTPVGEGVDFYNTRTVVVNAKFNKAFVLTPTTVKKLEKVTGLDLKSNIRVFGMDSNINIDKIGDSIVSKLKQNGYDGLIVKDFDQNAVFPKLKKYESKMDEIEKRATRKDLISPLKLSPPDYKL